MFQRPTVHFATSRAISVLLLVPPGTMEEQAGQQSQFSHAEAQFSGKRAPARALARGERHSNKPDL